MAYKKKYGHISMFYTAANRLFIDGVELKSRRPITIMFPDGVSDKMMAVVEKAVGTKQIQNLVVNATDDSDIYIFKGFYKFEELLGKRAKQLKTIKYDQLMEDLGRNRNEVKGSGRSKRVHGKNAAINKGRTANTYIEAALTDLAMADPETKIKLAEIKHKKEAETLNKNRHEFMVWLRRDNMAERRTAFGKGFSRGEWDKYLVSKYAVGTPRYEKLYGCITLPWAEPSDEEMFGG